MYLGSEWRELIKSDKPVVEELAKLIKRIKDINTDDFNKN